MTVDMLSEIFEILESCDGTEAMVLAAAALKQANKFNPGANRYSTREEFVRWFQNTAGGFQTRTLAENKLPEYNEWMSMSAG